MISPATATPRETRQLGKREPKKKGITQAGHYEEKAGKTKKKKRRRRKKEATHRGFSFPFPPYWSGMY